MSRRRAAEQRKIMPDPEYGDEVLAKFTNCLMMCGKKSLAESIMRRAFAVVAERTKRSPLEVFHEAIAAVRPLMEVRSRRVGGATYQVPVEVRDRRSLALSIRWLIDHSRKRQEKVMFLRVAGELMDASKGVGGAIKKRTDTHKMAESNKAYGHYRW